MSPRRRIMFRMVAVIMGLSVFVVVEVACRLTGAGAVSPQTAYSEFATIRPLFEQTAESGEYQIAANRRGFFAHDAFPIVKSTNERRIFVFGGSTVQGRPWSIQTSFTTYLEISLNHLQPEVKWRVINCGGVSYASYRLLPIMRECLSYQPDAYIVCTGHNEYLECVTYADVRSTAPPVMNSYRLLSRLHSFRLLQSAFVSDHQPQADRPILPAEVDALLDHQGGLAAYSRDALQRDVVVESFRRNVGSMAALAGDARLPLILVSPPSNLRDCPPFKSEFGSATSKADRTKVQQLLSAAADLPASDARERITKLREAADLDGQFAFSWYALGQALLASARTSDAEAALRRSRNEDVCPLRMTDRLRQVMQHEATQRQLPFIDLDEWLIPQSRDGLVGDQFLVDHIHPSFAGHQKIALLLTDEFVRLGLATVEDQDWQTLAQARFDSDLQSLDSLYFLRGQRTLESLQAWTQGRADGPPLQLDKR